MSNKIAMIYICTGKYRMFLEHYVNTCEKYFLPKCNKTYFIFSDVDVFDILKEKNIKYSYKYEKKMPFPMATLRRFHMINSIKDQLKEYDYIFFTNANMSFEKEINEKEILPTEEENLLVSVQHPDHFLNYNVNSYPYERNLKSSACVEYNYGKIYYQGCFFGGKTEKFLEMSEELQSNIDYDLSINHMAIWHDESHMNKYFAHTPPKCLSPSYSYPESRMLPNVDKIIVQIDKNKYGTYEYLRS